MHTNYFLSFQYFQLKNIFKNSESLFFNLGEFGWVLKPDGVVRMTKYTADRKGYRVKHITRQLEREKKNEVLIVGPIPPFLKKAHLAANQGAVIIYGQGGEQLDEKVEGADKNIVMEVAELLIVIMIYMNEYSTSLNRDFT